MKKQSFITSAALLALATGLGKIFSAVFKIPLDRFFLHADGMAIFNSAYNVYMFFFSAATAGIPLAISRLVAAADSNDEEQSVVSTALTAISAFMLLSAVTIFIFADAIAALTGMPDAAPSFRVIAPALLFCGISASLRGYFQGKMTMLPSALSQVSDSFGRLVLGFLLAFIFSSAAVAKASAGAISGVPLGALLSASILLFAFFKANHSFNLAFSGQMLKRILLLAIPITLTTSLHPIFNLADTMSVVPLLTYFSEPDAQACFGCLSRAATLYALPVSIATAVGASVLPAVTESAKKADAAMLNRDSSMAVRLALVISVPCAAGFMAIPKEILNLLYDSSANYTTLAFIAPSAIFLSVGGVLSGILQGMGKTRLTVIAALCAVFAKLSLNPVFIYFMGVSGAAAATSTSYFIFSVLMFFFIRSKTPVALPLSLVAIKPAICGFLCFATAFAAKRVLPTVLVIAAAAAVFVPAVFLTKFITFHEIYQIFSGEEKPLTTEKNCI